MKDAARKIIAIRADSSHVVGSGHVMRCLTLAEMLGSRGFKPMFICRDWPDHIGRLINERGFAVHWLPSLPQPDSEQINAAEKWPDIDWADDARETAHILEGVGTIDWLIVDHYLLDERWEKYMRRYAGKIAVIDDLANRPHDCDILLDQNLYEQTQKRYINLVPPACRLLLGPQYALLRSEFYQARATLPSRTGQIRSIFIFFGGSDLTNETEKTLTALQMLNLEGIKIDVVVGRSNRHSDHIRAICSSMPETTLYCQTNHMAELMAAADVAIGAGGTTTWERCFLGLPSLTVIVADNQREVTEMAAKAGVTVNLGLSGDVTAHSIAQALQGALGDPVRMRRMSANAVAIMGTDALPEQHPLVRQILEGKACLDRKTVP